MYETLGNVVVLCPVAFHPRLLREVHNRGTELPGLESFREARIDALLAHQTLAGGESIARTLDVPSSATVAVGLDPYAEADIPPFFSSLSYTGNPYAGLVFIMLYIVWGSLCPSCGRPC